jgi:aminopeptidase N
MLKRLLTIACLACSGGGAAEVPDATLNGPMDVVRYTLTLRPDIRTGTVSGVESVEFTAGKDVTHLRFSANGLTIERATIDGRPVDFAATGQEIAFTLPAPPRSGRTSTLRIVFAGKPKRGLTQQSAAIYSSYFACDWMFCLQDSPGDKAWFDLDLHLPTGASSVGSGRRLRELPGADGLTVHRWRARRPYSPYLFGFAAGTLQFARLQHGASRFTYVNASGGEADLNRLFDETPAIADFFASKAGLPLPDEGYTQVLVAGQEAQETASFSLIGRDALDRDLREPAKQWIIAHEMAHQWWGNLVTCATWQDFWLNEGFATFMTAAWKQHRFGEAAYQAELDVARGRVKRAEELGYDKPLTWNGAYPSLAMRRAVQYSKGALFLDRLRSDIGDRAFWGGIRTYTRSFAGKIVRSSDFERVMAEASGRDLSALFAQWVYGEPVATGR